MRVPLKSGEFPSVNPVADSGTLITCRERFGKLLKYSYRKVA